MYTYCDTVICIPIFFAHFSLAFLIFISSSPLCACLSTSVNELYDSVFSFISFHILILCPLFSILFDDFQWPVLTGYEVFMSKEY